jgi:beta-glucosidase-like glycosyl hydrolase
MRTPARRVTVLGCLLALLAACSPGTDRATSSGTATSTSSPPAAGPVTTPPPAAPAPADGPEAAVAAALAGMNRRAQVAQLFVAGIPLDDLSGGPQLAATGVGGIFLAGRSRAAEADLAATVTTWQVAAPGPRLWVAADQEGGNVQTLRGPGFDVLPTALQQGALPAPELGGLADRLGASLAGAGLNLDLAPVADVVPAGTEQSNPPIGVFARQYGSTPDAVVAAAGTIVGGLAAHGVTATLKHFPGLGRVQQNTDTSAHVVDGTTTAGDGQVGAFGQLAGSPAHPFVMMSSATYTLIDPTTEAVFSHVVLTDVLRTQLGFGGVVITDDVGTAKAVQAVPAGERAVRFLAAGGTLVLTVDSMLVPEMIDAVLARSDSDPAFAAQVDAALHTALLAKAGAGLLKR